MNRSFDDKNDTETENLMNRRHPCVAAPAGFAVSSKSAELKIARKQVPIGSLEKVLHTSPLWCTATVALIAAVGIVQPESEIDQYSFR
jgi:hypothetical protein